MSKIQEIIVEPNKIIVSSTFKLKVRVIDSYLSKQKIISENNKNIITEEGKELGTEWGK